ncbi:S-adenosyl-L-methionine-dependent methyltransferase [Sporodiniella umbellata]|nr:S-adenosyl-L-methionine-dependent methyltransferase [Sporodiniella umbellata]
MFKFAQSLLSSVFRTKRTLEEVNSTPEEPATKKAKLDVIHRVKVTNLPQAEMSQLKKFFKNEGYTRFKKAPKWSYCFLTVDTEEEALSCVKNLHGKMIKKNVLTAAYDPADQQEHRERFIKGKKSEPDPEDTRTSAEKLADQVTPLWRVDYEQQLKQKHRKGTKAMANLKNKLAKLCDDRTRGQIGWATERGMLPCEVLPAIASPQVDNYRTKCEFTIGKNLEGQPTVGFLLGLYREGITAVLAPDECKNVPVTANAVAKSMAEYIRLSDLPVYDRMDKTGCWRTVMTKTPSTGEVMVVVQLNSSELTEERLEQERVSLTKYWKNTKDVSVTTLIFQVWNGDSNGFTDKAPLEILFGDGYVHEELLGLRFRLSASAFFQINTPATEILYSKCAEWCNIDSSKKTTLLDLCCGTGTIGLTMAKSVDKVIGIEMVPEAIEDAKINAALNNVNNVTYYASRVEKAMHHVKNERNQEVIAVLDPPRNGVHSSVISACRENDNIDRVIYISCDSKQALDNFVALCRPQSNRFKGTPFKPSRAVTVDLFPHTEHSELLIEFVRIKPEEEESQEEEKVETVKNEEAKEESSKETKAIQEKAQEGNVKEHKTRKSTRKAAKEVKVETKVEEVEVSVAEDKTMIEETTIEKKVDVKMNTV